MLNELLNDDDFDQDLLDSIRKFESAYGAPIGTTPSGYDALKRAIPYLCGYALSASIALDTDVRVTFGDGKCYVSPDLTVEISFKTDVHRISSPEDVGILFRDFVEAWPRFQPYH